MDRKLSILIVDDVEDVRDALAMVLSEEGYAVTTAFNGNEALKELRNNTFDLVVTDILMPEKDGIEFVAEAKNLYPQLKYILISGGGRSTGSGSVLDYLEISERLTGIKQILKKPFKPEELLTLIKDMFSE